jgi:hypothetical protein
VIKYYKLIIKNFNQLKNDNFNQLNFGQVIISRLFISHNYVKIKKNANYRFWSNLLTTVKCCEFLKFDQILTESKENYFKKIAMEFVKD